MKKTDEITFEEAFSRLETIVRSLEEGQVPLDESMKLYEEGVSLVRLCSSKLENAKRQVLKVEADGTLSDFPDTEKK